MKIEIKKLGINGEGIGYIGGRKPIFVEGAFVGELVDVEIVEENERYATGKLLKIIKKSFNRIENVCKVKGCKACSLIELKAKEQVEVKRQIVAQSLYKYAGIPITKISRMQFNPNLFHYRNQLKMPFGEVDGVLCCGMYLPNSNIFVAVEECKVHESELDRRRREIVALMNQFGCKAYDKKTKLGYRTLVLRHINHKFSCTFVTGKEVIPTALVESIMKLEGMVNVGQSINTERTSEIYGSDVVILAGNEYLEVTLLNTRLRISNRSFFQLNTQQTLNLYGQVRKFLQNEHYGTIVEAYSGVGGLSLVLRDLADKIIGIENIKSAVENANENAKLNQASHVSFVLGDAGEEIQRLSRELNEIDVVVVDPPRTGLSDDFKKCILKCLPRKMVYVSCNLSTLGKDLSVLQEKYNVVKIVPFDMFSHTALVENVVLLERK